MVTQVQEFLERSAEGLPGKTALVFEDERWTYAGLEAGANRVARTLRSAGVRRGDRVLIHLQNSPGAVLAVFGALKAGAVFVVVNPTTKGDKLRFLLHDSGAAALFTTARGLDTVSDSIQELPSLRSVILAGPSQEERGSSSGPVTLLRDILSDRGAQETPPDPQRIDIDLAALVYTSGSTGRAKGVMLTHRNIISAATSITTYLENTQEDVILSVLPMSFDYGLYQILMAFQVGATVVLERGFTYPAVVLKRLQEERVTGFPILPTILAILFQLDLGRHDFSSLRYVTNTGAALPGVHIRKMRELWPEVKIYSMYGLTECKRVAYLPPDQIDLRPVSVGKAMPNTEVYVVGDDGKRHDAAASGELVVRGSNVMKGYWGLPEETDAVLRPGPLPGERVLYTGDIFRIDEEGYLYFVGRKDDIIKSRGEKVSPKEVEDVLYRLDGVAEAAVIGVPDAVLGQAVKAFVKPRDGVQLSERDVIRHCALSLENYMVPASVEIRADFARTSSGKIDKTQLS